MENEQPPMENEQPPMENEQPPNRRPRSVWNWHEFPDIPQHIISQYVNDDKIARQRIERVLVFRFAQRAVCNVALGPLINQVRQFHNVQMYNKARAEVLLRELINIHFSLDEGDDVNIDPADWARVNLSIQTVIEKRGPGDILGAAILTDNDYAYIVHAVSDSEPGQGGHRFAVTLPMFNGHTTPPGTMSEQRPVAIIEYRGCLRWQTFNAFDRGRLVLFEHQQSPAQHSSIAARFTGATKNAYFVTAVSSEDLGSAEDLTNKETPAASSEAQEKPACWDDLEFELKRNILTTAHEEMRAERYRAREMDYLFVGHVRDDDRQQFWDGLQFLLEFDRVSGSETWPLTMFWKLKLETVLRNVVTRLFVPLDDFPVEMNLTGQAWTQITFHIHELIHENNTHLVMGNRRYRRVGFRARSADRLHTILLIMIWESHTERRAQIMQIRYRGPQRFHTLEPRHLSTELGNRGVADVGYLMESHLME